MLKHFLAYNVETERDVIDVDVPARVLHEYELPAFRGPIAAGVAAGVMPGYNLTNGIPNHVHPLINDALRAWNPDLVVCSDAQAPSNLVEREKYFATHAESHAAALKAGVDSYTDNGPDSAPDDRALHRRAGAGPDHRGRHRRGGRPAAGDAGRHRRVRHRRRSLRRHPRRRHQLRRSTTPWRWRPPAPRSSC